MEIAISNGKYQGFQLNRPEYTAYPAANEFLLLDGADTVVEEVVELQHPKYDNTKYTKIKMR